MINIEPYLSKLDVLKEYITCFVDHKAHRVKPVVLDSYFRDARKPSFEEYYHGKMLLKISDDAELQLIKNS